MRRLILLMVVCSMSVWWGCGDDAIEVVGLDDIESLWVTDRYEDTCGSNTCYYEYRVNLKQKGVLGEYYLYSFKVWRPRQNLPDEVYYHKNGAVKLSHSRETDEYKIRVPYFALTPQSTYHLTVFRADYPSGDSISQKRCDSCIQVGSFGTGCLAECCTGPPLHAGIRQNVSEPSITGVMATVKALDATVCREQESDTILSSSAAVVAVVYDTAGFREHNSAWAQSAVVSIRFNGEDFTQLIAISEVFGSDYDSSDIVYDPYPLVDGTAYWLKTELQTSDTVLWCSYIDDNPIGIESHLPDSFWDILDGNNVRFFGEISHYECDMMGTAQDKCTFGRCMYKSANSWVSTDFVNGDALLMNMDASEWFVIVAGADSLEIGDLSIQ
jgi:hypothetical protein